MGQDPGIAILIALITAGASILVAWITTRGKDGGPINIATSSVGPSQRELRGTVPRLISAGVLYGFGGLFLLGGVYSYIQIQSYESRMGAVIGRSGSEMPIIVYSELFMGIVAIGAAIFIHMRAKKIVREYISPIYR